MVQQEVGSGNTSDLLAVIAVSPSLARLGAALDATTVEVRIDGLDTLSNTMAPN